jgi:tetratricopeptide (TPR) repeat protein
MSLLLQALKKAEEAKRLREAAELAGAEQENDLSAADLSLNSSLALDEVKPEEEVLSVEEEQIAPLSLEEQAEPSPWVFVPLPLDEPSTPPLEPFIDSDPIVLEPPAPLVEEPPLPPVETPAAKPLVPEEDLAWLKANPPPSPPPAAALTSSPPAPPKSPPPIKPRQRSKILPWLVLCGFLIVGVMGGYFWWQYQAMSPIAAAPAASVAPAAVEPEPSPAVQEVISPPPSAAVALPASVTAVAPIAKVSPPAFKGDAASVVERSLAPSGAGVRFDTQNTEAAVPLPLLMAYRSFQQGDYRAAEEGYRRMLQLDPRNRDALLGMAALAIKRGEGAEAAHFYRQILSLYPRDEVAQSALYSLTPTNSEAGLRQLSNQQADAAFALANLYAGQNRWSEAQSAYFQALSLDAGNADYAFNLAISLEHLQENKSAARYYRQALAGKGTFDRAIAEARLQALESP